MNSAPRRSATSSWQIRVDVGGTFTDGWALDPSGHQLRCKVLSSGVIRTRVAAIEGDWIICERSLSAHSSGLEGFTSSTGDRVIASQPNQARLRFTDPSLYSVGDPLELSTGEDAPILAVRILTGTAVGADFPPLDFRVATTRGTNALLEGKGEPVDLYTSAGFETLLEVRDQRRPDLFELAPAISIPVTRRVIGIPGRLSRDGEELQALDEAFAEEIHSSSAVAIAMLHSDVAPQHELRVAEILADHGISNPSVSHQLAPVIRLWPRMETTVANAYLTPIMGGFLNGLQSSLPGVAISLMTSAGQLKSGDDFRPIDSLLSGPAGGISGAAALAKAAGLTDVLTFDMGGTSTDVARISGEPGYRYEQEIGPVKVLAPAVKIETVAAGGGSICRWRNGGLEVGPESAGSTPGPACYGQGGPLTVTDVNLLLGNMDPAKAGVPLDPAASESRLSELIKEVGGEIDRQELLAGLRRIAIEHMAEALRQVSTREGYDCRDHALIAFGGAGPQHACALARELGITTVLIPADAGLLSAWGLHQAGDRELRTRQILGPLTNEVPRMISDLAEGKAVHRCLHELRLRGQDSCLEIEASPDASAAELIGAFENRYQKLYGYPRPLNRELEWVTLRVELTGSSQDIPPESFTQDALIETDRILQDGFSTLCFEVGWRIHHGSAGTIKLTLEEQSEKSVNAPAVIQEELYRRRFEGIVNEMGELLRRTALSTNIKERLDYSCALLDPQGRLVVNAPHIPVHLGALGLCVRRVGESYQWKSGESIVVNHPAFGGSHLPDVTVISPVFDQETLIGFVANRAHHAEIGGRTPGSMPPDARVLSEEGVVIPPTDSREIDADFFAESRAPGDNLADLSAQLASNHHGVAALQKIGASAVEHMENLYRRTAKIFRDSLRDFPKKSARDQLDDGSVIQVGISLTDHLIIDFSGSAPTHPGNLNATPAIVRSAVLYALRLWVNEDLPLNEGLLDQVEIITEEGILDPPLTADPQTCPAVVGGNVETSQRIVDVLLSALGLQSHGQGTMNNFLFGNERFGFYETLGGGAGAGPHWHGRSGCHVHMSNTAVTDVEILEERYPVRVHEFGIRENSGGSGTFRGGDGLVREIEFLEEMTVSLLTQRRLIPPNPNGACGSQQLLRHGEATWEDLPGTTSFEVGPHDRLRILTPGGGGFS